MTETKHRCHAWRGDGERWVCLECGARDGETNPVTDRTGEDDDTFAALLARVEAAEEAPESVRERMARAMADCDGIDFEDWSEVYKDRADAAFSVLKEAAK